MKRKTNDVYAVFTQTLKQFAKIVKTFFFKYSFL